MVGIGKSGYVLAIGKAVTSNADNLNDEDDEEVETKAQPLP